jgi:tetratricopeptide (TPR) repeat protein
MLRNAYPRAIDTYREALAIFEDIGDRHWQVNGHWYLGVVYTEVGQPKLALEHVQQALDICVELDNPPAEARLRWVLSLILDGHGQRAAAIEQAQSALVLFNQLDDPTAAAVKEQLTQWEARASPHVKRRNASRSRPK